MADELARRSQYEYKAVSKIILTKSNKVFYLLNRIPILSYKLINL